MASLENVATSCASAVRIDVSDNNSDDDSDMSCSDKEDTLGPLHCKWPFGGKGKSSDVPVPSGVGCTQISKILAQVRKSAGEYTFGGVANTLPVVPGLFVDGVGQIPVPLTGEYAEKLIAKCEKSPFGHNFDTKMDESVRKSWQLEPNQVKLWNPNWQSGIGKLTQSIAERLGYNSVPMQCILYKVLVYGEGGHFLKHQDTEKEGGMIATLVIQLPSTHEGGDLVVYEGGEVKYRHDFGKADGTAAYLPQYAVHYADAEHALENVTKGFRLVLVYSLCLPLQTRNLKLDHDTRLNKKLAEAICSMEKEEMFTLLQVNEYGEKSIVDLGSSVLESIDRARFIALEEANKSVSDDKKLQFYIAEVKHHIEYYSSESLKMGCWKESYRDDKITWFSTSGELLGVTKSAMKMNFLNPDLKTFRAMWREYGSCRAERYSGNEGSSMNTVYSRFAIMAWPAIHAVENALECINVDVAVKVLQSQKPISAKVLGQFMSAAKAKLEEEEQTWSNLKNASVDFTKTLCELLVDADDTALVNAFFTNIFCRVEKPIALPPSIIPIVRKFDWSEISKALLDELDKLEDQRCMAMVLHIVDGLDAGPAQISLLKLAVERAAKLPDKVLCSSNTVGILWKWVLRSGDKEVLDVVVNIFER